jgi:hypothetical protein
MSTNDLEGTNPNLPPSSGPSPHHGYDPNQPRVPTGHRDGGQWTRTPGSGGPASARREAVVDRTREESWGSYVNTYRADGTLAEQRVFNRDRSRIVSEFNVPGSRDGWDERHTVVLADGSKVSFQNSGDVQTIYDSEGRLVSAAVWTEDGPQPLPVGELASSTLDAAGSVLLRVPGSARIIMSAALALYAWLLARKDRDGTAVFAFKAAKYERTGEKGQPGLTWVGYVKQDELRDVCRRLGKVQKLTDEAVDTVRKDGKYKGPADFGTQVHEEIARAIEKIGDPNFRFEVSVIKSKLEAVRYGEPGSVRMDAYENREDISTVCVYDPKTGKRGLSFPRMTELADAAHRLFQYDPQHIIVIEVRPGQRFYPLR